MGIQVQFRARRIRRVCDDRKYSSRTQKKPSPPILVHRARTTPNRQSKTACTWDGELGGSVYCRSGDCLPQTANPKLPAPGTANLADQSTTLAKIIWKTPGPPYSVAQSPLGSEFSRVVPGTQFRAQLCTGVWGFQNLLGGACRSGDCFPKK